MRHRVCNWVIEVRVGESSSRFTYALEERVIVKCEHHINVFQQVVQRKKGVVGLQKASYHGISFLNERRNN